MDEDERAIDIFTRMFQTLYRSAGLVWTDDNTADIEDAVHSICRSAE